MSESFFKPAQKQETKLKIALSGPSGSGKTYSALRLATGIGRALKANPVIAVVDTENGSAALYSDKFKFITVSMNPPYLTKKYVHGIDQAVNEGVDVLILDSISHAWAGTGGILQRKEMLDSGGKGNSFTNWARFTPEYEQFIAKILHSNVHLIACMRSKTEYLIVDQGGRSVPKKVGMAPVQRSGIEYEFTTVFDIAINHHAEVSKDRTGLYSDQVFQITEETGEGLVEWLGGAPPPKVTKKIDPKPKPKSNRKPKAKPKVATTRKSQKVVANPPKPANPNDNQYNDRRALLQKQADQLKAEDQVNAEMRQADNEEIAQGVPIEPEPDFDPNFDTDAGPGGAVL